jgi:hypothetical protein
MSSRQERQRVAELVRQAFRGVTLGDGVGLRQAEGMDSYESAARLAALRSEDEKLDWQLIPAADLNIYCNSLSYLDAEGMRFLLPAYLLAELNDALHIEFVFHLTFFGFGAMSRFRLLDAAQKGAVRAFLVLRLSETNCDAPEYAMIKSALETFWTTQPC